MEKKKIRQEITALMKMLDENDIAYLSDRICSSFCSLNEYKASKVLYAFLSPKHEVDKCPIITRAWKDGKKVAIPKVMDKGKIEFGYISSFNELVIGNYGVCEPYWLSPACDRDVLIIVPGVAFDYALNRIGNSWGFYDKYFTTHTDMNFTKVSVAYNFQIYKHLSDFDNNVEPLDLIVTPTMVI